MRTLYLPASSVADRAPAQPSIYSATANSQSMSASVSGLINVFNDLDVRSLSPLLKSYLRGFRNDEERVLVAYCLAVRPATAGSGHGRWSTRRMPRSARSRSGWRRIVTCGHRTRSAGMRRRWRSGGRSSSSATSRGSGEEAGVLAVTGFLSWLRNGRTVERSLAVPDGAPSADTLNARLAALLSFYQWQAAVHDVPVASRLMRGRPSRVPSRGLLARLDGRRGLAPTSLVKVRRGRRDRPRCCCRRRSRRSSTGARPGIRRRETGRAISVIA